MNEIQEFIGALRALEATLEEEVQNAEDMIFDARAGSLEEKKIAAKASLEACDDLLACRRLLAKLGVNLATVEIGHIVFDGVCFWHQERIR